MSDTGLIDANFLIGVGVGVGVAWRGVAWRGVAWRGVACDDVRVREPFAK